jgi:hypothetical protein
MRIELTTSSLPRKCSTPELQRLVQFVSANRSFVLSLATSEPKNPEPGTTPERKTRFEPATYSLEGCRSTN